MKKESGSKNKQAFWQPIVKAYFDFYEKKFEEIPSFDGSSPRDLNSIIEALKKRATLACVIWTEDIAVSRVLSFLEFCYNDSWLRDNFMLQNLNRQKDKIFLKIKASRNGKPSSSTEKRIGGNIKTMGQDIFAQRLQDGLTSLRDGSQEDVGS